MEMEFIFSVGFTPTSGVSVNVDLCECRVKRAALHVLNVPGVFQRQSRFGRHDTRVKA